MIPRLVRPAAAVLLVVLIVSAIPAAAVAQEVVGEAAGEVSEVDVRIVARRLDDGRVEFGLQQRGSGGAWGQRMLPSRRFFPAGASEGRWLASSALRVTAGGGGSGMEVDVRIVARRLDDGRVEFGLQQRGSGGAWEQRMLPSRRFFPAGASEGRWLASSALLVTAAGEGPRAGDTRIAAERGVPLVAASGYHTCAIDADGGVDCWGDNTFGSRLGDPSIHQARSPVPVEGLVDAVAISVGDSQSSGADGPTCVLHGDRTISCWGHDPYGALGQETPGGLAVPTRVPGIADAVDVTVGARHACVAHADGGASCWGSNALGQLGDGTVQSRSRPDRVPGLSGVVSIGAGAWHTCAVHSDGTASCWGSNSWGQLGDGTRSARLSPVSVRDLDDAGSVSPGTHSTCAVRRSGEVSCWGQNESHLHEATGVVVETGILGTGSRSSYLLLPARVVGITDAVAVGTGVWSSCALHRDGGLSCWGTNATGELGIGTMDDRREPQRLRGISDAVAITVSSRNGWGGSHACAITANNGTWCWGDNRYGQLGVGDTEPRLVPTQVAAAGSGDGTNGGPPTVIPTITVPDWSDEASMADAGPFRSAMDDLVRRSEDTFPWLRIAWDSVRSDVRLFDLASGGVTTVGCGFFDPDTYECRTSKVAIGTHLGESSLQELLRIGVHELAHVYDGATALTPNRAWGAVQLYFAVNYPNCNASGEETIADTMLHLVFPDAPLTYYGPASACLGTPSAPTEEDLDVLRSGLAGEVPAWYTRTIIDGADLWWTLRGLPTMSLILSNLMGEFGGLCRTDFLRNWSLLPLRKSNPFRDGGC